MVFSTFSINSTKPTISFGDVLRITPDGRLIFDSADDAVKELHQAWERILAAECTTKYRALSVKEVAAVLAPVLFGDDPQQAAKDVSPLTVERAKEEYMEVARKFLERLPTLYIKEYE